MKLQYHSVTDLITNSSTTIYTSFHKSVEPCKEMINEFFKAFNIDKTCDEVFEIELENEGDEYEPATISIIARDEKYSALADRIYSFLTSGESLEFES